MFSGRKYVKEPGAKFGEREKACGKHGLRGSCIRREEPPRHQHPLLFRPLLLRISIQGHWPRVSLSLVCVCVDMAFVCPHVMC